MKKIATYNQYSSRWTAKHWVLWLLLPTLLLFAVTISVVSFLPETWTFADIEQANYWQPQVEWFIALNDWLGFLSHGVWFNLTLLGDASVLLPLVFIFVYRTPQAAAALWFTVPIAGFLSWVLKGYFEMPRPATVLDHDLFTIIGDKVAGLSSLPSGHSITYVAIGAALLVTFIPRPQKTIDCLVLVVVGVLLLFLCLSRVAVGAHWPLDTIAGAGLGFISGVLGGRMAWRFRQGWQKLFSSKGRFFHVPLYIFWFSILWLESQNQPFIPWFFGPSMLACVLLVYWPWSMQADIFRRQMLVQKQAS